MSGCRAGAEQWVAEYGPSGDNGKGTRRTLREFVSGAVDREQNRGYTAVVKSSLVKDQADTEKPSEQLAKCANAREVVIDDFATSRQSPLCNETLRNYTGGNTIATAGKHEKERNMDTNWLIRLIFNYWPEFDKPLGESDMRRLGLLYFPKTYKPLTVYDASNPTHRLQRNFKDNMVDFAAELVEWMRLLAHTTRAGGAKFMLPEPTSNKEILASLMGTPVASDADVIGEFVKTHLRALGTNERPSSREAINMKCASVVFGGSPADTVKGQVQLGLRRHLLAPEKKWQRCVNGERSTPVQVYKFSEGASAATFCTIKEDRI